MVGIRARASRTRIVKCKCCDGLVLRARQECKVENNLDIAVTVVRAGSKRGRKNENLQTTQWTHHIYVHFEICMYQPLPII